MTPGACFVALHGEHQDGHHFIPQALARGARAIIAEKGHAGGVGGCWLLDATTPPPPLSALSEVSLPLCVLVEDSLAALQRWAAYWRRQHPVRLIGVTGSVGKTVTREAICSLLSRRFCTLESEANYNNEIGLPLTLLRLTAQHERAVVEMGMYGLGEIAQLAQMARPAVGVVTNVEPVHLERLGTVERIAKAKRELVEALPLDGTAVLNGDDQRVIAMAGYTKARILSYGRQPSCDVWADQVVSQGLQGLRFRLHYGERILDVQTPLLGCHSVYTALAAIAVGLAERLSLEEILAGLEGIRGQLRLVRLPGLKGSTLLDDTYNASPMSTIAALNLLQELPGRKIAVLGDMLELGDLEEEGHRRVGQRVAGVTDWLVVVGRLGRLIGEEALAQGMDGARVLIVEEKQRAIDRLRVLVREGDVVLVKGSRGMAMEEIVQELCLSGRRQEH